MQYTENVIILAAGLGSRLGMDLPKCLVEIHDKKLIDYQLELLKNFKDIRIVTGFKEQEVINHVIKSRPDAVFVRNPDYITTNTTCSAHLAARHINKPFILMDGDIHISPETFHVFLEQCSRFPNSNIVCVTEARTEEPVYAHVVDGNIVKFSRDEKSEYEWSGVAYVATVDFMGPKDKYIYQMLEKKLPLKSCVLDVLEIDTPKDYDVAVKTLV